MNIRNSRSKIYRKFISLLKFLKLNSNLLENLRNPLNNVCHAVTIEISSLVCLNIYIIAAFDENATYMTKTKRYYIIFRQFRSRLIFYSNLRLRSIIQKIILVKNFTFTSFVRRKLCRFQRGKLAKFK